MPDPHPRTLISDAADDAIEGDPAVRHTIVVDLAHAAALQTDPVIVAQLEQQVRAGSRASPRRCGWTRTITRCAARCARSLPDIGTLAITGSCRGAAGRHRGATAAQVR